MFSFVIFVSQVDHIWLNEGFATYLSNIGCEAIYDRSFVWPFFYYFYQRGTMIMDVGAKLKEKTTVPSTSDILTYKDVQQIFIHYWRVLNRGASMLHMLRSMLGDKAVFPSITSYFTTWGLDKKRDYIVLHSGGKLLPA